MIDEPVPGLLIDEPDTVNVKIDADTSDEPLWSPIVLGRLNTSVSDVI